MPSWIGRVLALGLVCAGAAAAQAPDGGGDYVPPGSLPPAAAAGVEKPFDQTRDIVWGEWKGKPLLMDLFRPNGKARHAFLEPNENGRGLGIVDVVCGGWRSKRSRQEDHERAAMFDIFAARGYTVFAMRIASLPENTGLEMADSVRSAIRWVKAHAHEYGVDPDRLGIVGASAGAHLAALALSAPWPAAPDAADPLARPDTGVAAAALFFPPTDFLDWNGALGPYRREPELLFNDGIDGKSLEQIRAVAEALSPARQVRPGMPPVFLCHGEQDPVVPVQQAHRYAEALRAQGNEVVLRIAPGGGHFWITIPFDIIAAADWLDGQLAGARAAP